MKSPIELYKSSFGVKVCFWVLLTAVIVLQTAFGFSMYMAEKHMLQAGHKEANLELDKCIEFISKEISGIEIAGRNLIHTYPHEHHISKEELFKAFESFLECNKNVQGIAFGFEKNVYPEYKDGFCPYIIRTKKGYEHILLNEKRDYLHASWYTETKKKDVECWSDPFEEVNGSIICSYCIPVHDDDGHFLGVAAIDLSIKDLREFVSKIKPYENAYVAILDRKLRFIVNPNKEYVLGETINDILEDQKGVVENESIYIDMLNGKRNMRNYEKQDEKTFVYYAPIKSTGWTVALECRASDILKGAWTIRKEMWIISLIGLLPLLGAMIIVTRKVTKPVKKFSKAASNIANGNFNTRLPKIESKDELWQLSQSLDNMQHSLSKYIENLKETQAEKGRIASELMIASKIQQSMLPKVFPPFPERNDIDLFGSLTPAKEVGGDLFDFFIHDEQLFFCVGDVSGKGVPAALVMAVTRSLIRIVAARENNPSKIMIELNNLMSDNNDALMFVTMFVGVLDLANGKLHYCNAGHNAPVITTPEGEVTKLDVVPNMPLALMEEMEFESQEIYLKPGSSIFIYTDGVTEAENPEKELYGDNRLLEILKTTANMNPTEQSGKVIDDVHKHVNGAEQSDDITMLNIRYKGQLPGGERIKEITLHNDVSQVTRLNEFVTEVSKESGIDDVIVDSIVLAIEEAVVNVMNYAYPKDTDGLISLKTVQTEQDLTFVLSDSGTPFDPTEQPLADVSLGLDEREIGGLGIFLMREIMDSIEYERKDDKNILTMVKKLNTQTT